MQCISLHKSECLPEEPGLDQIYVMLLPENVSILYRMTEDGNKFPTDAVMESLKKREEESCCPVGSVQIMSGGVPEILLNNEISRDEDKIKKVCAELNARNLVPQSTPVYGVYNGFINEIGPLNAVCSTPFAVM